MGIQNIILMFLTLQPHNLAHPQPFSDDKVETAWGIPFGFRKAMGRKRAAVAAAFHR